MENETVLYLEALKESYSTFKENVWKLAGLCVVVLGWLITSKNAREYLGNNIIGKIILTTTFVLAGLSHCYVNYNVHIRSKNLVKELTDKVDKSIYGAYEVTMQIYCINSFLLTFMLFLSCILTVTI